MKAFNVIMQEVIETQAQKHFNFHTKSFQNEMYSVMSASLADLVVRPTELFSIVTWRPSSLYTLKKVKLGQNHLVLKMCPMTPPANKDG